MQNIFGFNPSVAACVVFIVVFTILSAAHIYLVAKKRVLYFSVFCIGGVFEVLGYITRIISGHRPSEVGPYAAQTLFILLPPCFFAASIYMTLGRLIRYLHVEDLSPMKLKIITPIFVFGDVLSLLLQGAGGGIQASGGAHNHTLGSDVVIGGLIVQLIFFGAFIIVSTIVHRRIRKINRDLPVDRGTLDKFFLVTYAACILILIRNVYRIIEYAQGFQGFLMVHEVFMYIFDAVLMTGVMVVFIIMHPGNVMVRNVMEKPVSTETFAQEEGPFNLPYEGERGDQIHLTAQKGV
ncbi:Rta1p [Sugiyamaella lignohabitans]|uniref:Rta1p n=1 Tax=Sugiyamaella lignohabitans TaxID=796027 RepID=A0A161HMQ5_9ASCO|nr:Rta1p [Sugiyamaella lignohabitans]ANB15147.1 Rta1p [Sugiyamaella lignohabitans]